MAARGSRKRAAPGTSPQMNVGQTDYNVQSNPDQFLWPQKAADSLAYSDSTDPFSANLYSVLANQTINSDPTQSNQVARRRMQSIASKSNFVNGIDNTWNGVMDSASQPGEFTWFQRSDEERIDAEAREAMDGAKKSRKSIPPFVMKLRSFLDEDKNTELIRWSTIGDSFVVLDEEEFARTLIPELFKHANYASFVRQLNMYGFHKQVGLSDNSMRASERKNKCPSEYKNSFFRRGKPEWMWLIQKPKPAGTRSRGGRGKTDDMNEDEDFFDGDHITPSGNPYEDKNNIRPSRPPLLISQGIEPATGSGALAKEELAEVHREIKVIRQQNLAIANIIAKMKRDQDQLNAQAQAFQEQHSRHENSINAILTFLATVYNRSLENHQGQDVGAMFANAMPQAFQQQHGSVVDVGDLGDQDLQARASPSGRIKRQPLLLQAPPGDNSPAASTATSQQGNQPQVQNMRRTSSSNQNSRSVNSGFVLPEDGNMLSWINTANSNDTTTPSSQMDFGEALSHLQNRNGKGPLSASERNGMLEMMSNGNGSSVATPQEVSNALITPQSSTPVLNPKKLAETSNDLDVVNRTLKNSQHSLDQIISRLSPMSPGGPDFSGQEYVPPPEAGLDFDSMFNADEYLNDPAAFGPLPTDFGENDFSFDAALGTGEGQFDGTNDENDDDDTGGGRIQSLNESEATSPAQTIEEDEIEEIASPRKRMRKG